MNDHNLDDLIIDEAQPAQSNKAKSFLTIIALAIVVLIVSIIFTKVMLKAPKQDQLLFEQNETEMISPDLTLQSVTEPEETTAESPEPIKDDAALAITQETEVIEKKEEIPAPAEMIKEIPEPSEKPVIAELPEVIEEATKELVPESEPVEQEPKPEPIVETEEDKATDILNIVEEPSKSTVQPVTKENIDIVPQQKVDTSTNGTMEQTAVRYRPANVITRPQENHTKYTPNGHYYIQVGAFSNAPSKRFLDKITKNGFNYTITKRSPSGLKKLLIGPYPDQNSAERALIRVKELLNKRAFVLRKK